MRFSLFQQSFPGLSDLAIGLSVVERFSLKSSNFDYILNTTPISSKMSYLEQVNEIERTMSIFKKLNIEPSRFVGLNVDLLNHYAAGGDIQCNHCIDDISALMMLQTCRAVVSYDLDSILGPVEFRIGKPYEYVNYNLQNVPISLNQLPILSDNNGPFGSPSWFNLKPVTSDTTRFMTIIYSFTGYQGLESQLKEVQTYQKLYAQAQIHYSAIISGCPSFIIHDDIEHQFKILI